MSGHDFFSAVSDAEGDMRRVYDHAYLIYDHLSNADRITLDGQSALSWVACDLLKAGEALRGHVDTLYAVARAEKPIPNAPQIEGGPIFEPAKLSMEGLFSLHDALKTVFDVLAGLENQPRFVGQKSSDPLPPAGDMLQKLSEYIAEVLSQIHDEACARKVSTKGDLERKFFFLAGQFVDGLTSPQYAAAEIAKIPEALS